MEDRGVYDAEDPYGPFTCAQCGTEYDELEELDPKPEHESDDAVQRIFDIMESALALAGYEVLDGDHDSFIIRYATGDADFEIKVSKLIAKRNSSSCRGSLCTPANIKKKGQNNHVYKTRTHQIMG